MGKTFDEPNFGEATKGTVTKKAVNTFVKKTVQKGLNYSVPKKKKVVKIPSIFHTVKELNTVSFNQKCNMLFIQGYRPIGDIVDVNRYMVQQWAIPTDGAMEKVSKYLEKTKPKAKK